MNLYKELNYQVHSASEHTHTQVPVHVPQIAGESYRVICRYYLCLLTIRDLSMELKYSVLKASISNT